jgi:hypothetical protein
MFEEYGGVLDLQCGPPAAFMGLAKGGFIENKYAQAVIRETQYYHSIIT